MTKPSLPSLWSRRPQTLEAFGALQREIDRVFDDFHPFRLARGASMGPRLDISETDGEYVIEAELPGVGEADVDVSVENDLITIKGEKKIDHEDKSKDYHLIERAYGAFSRSVSLPFSVDPAKVTATFDGGVLRVTAPKPSEAKAEKKKVEITKA
jgi:HSP20 family protein